MRRTELLAYRHCSPEKTSTRSVVEATTLRKCALRRRVLATSAQLSIPKIARPNPASRRSMKTTFDTFLSLRFAIERATFNDTFEVRAVRIVSRVSGDA